jgi:hypothetical protein
MGDSPPLVYRLADAFAEIECYECRVTSIRLSLVDFDSMSDEARKVSISGFDRWERLLWGAHIIVDEDQPVGTWILDYEHNSGNPRKTAWDRVLFGTTLADYST